MIKVTRTITIVCIIILLISTFSLMLACSSDNYIVVVDSNNGEGNTVFNQEVEIVPTSISITSTLEPITFGKYPQTAVDSAHVATLPESNGYYFSTDKNYYAKKNDIYYRVEDVTWDAFLLDNGDILLISQNILFAARYDDYYDYFEYEREIFDEKGFIFTQEEEARICESGIEYSNKVYSSAKFLTRMFLINSDQLLDTYKYASNVFKKPTDYVKDEIPQSEYGYSAWWLAPTKAKNYYVSYEGTISNKSNTYVTYIGVYPVIKYAVRGIAPAMIISNN